MDRRKSNAINLAKDFKRKAAKKFGISRIILFGSFATGRPHKWSDIDLLVVSNRVKKKSDFMSKLSWEWHIKQKKDFPIDFICYTSKEFQKLSKEISIVSQALKEGIEL
ncbi:MAG: hypothetical protein COY38_02505 [Candidatus Aenigmarchaeota archaeon CG_4_10_14_0_8_um_filter_37_24]|nr:nucleotidyltransferase domain-containing protein [Candidatus Aenigmarchaeota archaeon]PIV69291.1 MAG: hypothetical protein COS07_01355 [Candidatus Aenigmarchaeota archaeon CG01_land_8_20_14_3_00_37_9]PIW41373.1 MAG: hypothetical protein COW21_02275 [Candidatus Aenigmarchaeota archaeon CG15_BIG_FIL_POST_REV_8_21_14_020_37_27]PIX50348.1 MAG: hypothetical protein COZ52_04590 [Candidatus Aenigmarchaeota archaeon CG_4_8_14_3_um_filter_37_24]PIY34965.1 MAG: hypothetical protein COZ04_04980 [Candid